MHGDCFSGNPASPVNLLNLFAVLIDFSANVYYLYKNLRLVNKLLEEVV